MYNHFSRLKVLSWSVPTFFAVCKSAVHPVPPASPLGPHRRGCGSRAERWGRPRHLPSEQGAGDALLCITSAPRSKYWVFFQPDVVVLLEHCSHLNLLLRNVFGFILVSVLFSKSFSVTTNFPIQLCFLFYFSMSWDSQDVYFHGININVMFYNPNVSQLIKYLNIFCKNVFCLLLRRCTHLCIIICRLLSTPEHRRILLVFKIPLKSNDSYIYILIYFW